ncbi:MAG: Crp/Fnr family transcriptional regulator [Saprospiraceae bacterium]|nr:Crp/Fnr family transcriptional regulator [Saprospiraceae bacterium]
MENSQLWFLENVDVTGIFCPQKMMAHPEKHIEKNFKKGEYIYLPDDHSDKIYFILYGRVKIGSFGDADKEIIKAVLGKGEVFGELALISSEKRGDFALTMEETEVCIVHKKDIKELFKDRSGLQNFFLKLFGTRIMEMENRLESLVFKDSRSRIVDFLLEMALRRGERVGYETVVRKFLTHQEIANLTATSRQTVTTVLNDLRNKGLIKFDRRRLLIRDKDKLSLELNS